MGKSDSKHFGGKPSNTLRTSHTEFALTETWMGRPYGLVQLVPFGNEKVSLRALSWCGSSTKLTTILNESRAQCAAYGTQVGCKDLGERGGRPVVSLRYASPR